MATAFPDVKPFPGAASQAAAPMGHNRPPIEEQGVKRLFVFKRIVA